MIWRDESAAAQPGGGWRAIDDRCPHRLAPMSLGRVDRCISLSCFSSVSRECLHHSAGSMCAGWLVCHRPWTSCELTPRSLGRARRCLRAGVCFLVSRRHVHQGVGKRARGRLAYERRCTPSQTRSDALWTLRKVLSMLCVFSTCLFEGMHWSVGE